MTTTSNAPTLTDRHPADSVAAELLWDALYLARIGKTRQSIADLEDAVFRHYLSMAPDAGATVATEPDERGREVEHAAELGLAHAVLAWRHRTSGGFRQFARSTVMRQC